MSDAQSAATPLRIVVLTCAGLGLETAAALEAVPGVEVVAVFDSPHRRLSLWRRLRKIWRARGLAGTLLLGARKITRLLAPDRSRGDSGARSAPRCNVIAVDDLHAPETIERLRQMAPDVGVVDGTYILKPVLFDLPRHGCINLHCGRVPEYRGAPPAFWELYDGVPEVGITVHRVTQKVDEGPVYMERSFPLELAPAGDPVRYVEEYWRSTLRPEGIALLQQVIAGIRQGTVEPLPQRQGNARTHRFPSRHDVRELRARVRTRRHRG